MARSVDVLVVDEAVQLSLANAVGVSRGAQSMVLLGDPQQLKQPTRALHFAGPGSPLWVTCSTGTTPSPPTAG